MATGLSKVNYLFAYLTNGLTFFLFLGEVKEMVFISKTLVTAACVANKNWFTSSQLSIAETLVLSACNTDVLMSLMANFDKRQCRQLWLNGGTFECRRSIRDYLVITNGSLATNAIIGCSSVLCLQLYSTKCSRQKICC